MGAGGSSQAGGCHVTWFVWESKSTAGSAFLPKPGVPSFVVWAGTQQVGVDVAVSTFCDWWSQNNISDLPRAHLVLFCCCQFLNHDITEPLRLEKTSSIIQSNLRLIPPCPSPILIVLSCLHLTFIFTFDFSSFFFSYHFLLLSGEGRVPSPKADFSQEKDSSRLCKPLLKCIPTVLWHTEIYVTGDSKMILFRSALSMNSFVPVFHSYRLSLWDTAATLPE